jgi:glycosyltransferase involved in cell wall biosynthesis
LQSKSKDKITLVYHSTPHRGLDILVNVFEKLCEYYDNLELKVHSSFEVYGEDWSGNQKQYEQSELYQRLEQHPKIQNIGFVSNQELKKSLASSHIFPYPCIWKETFCLSLLEAMSAGLLCVHSSLGALPELSSNWTMMYSFDENIKIHEERFYKKLKNAIEIVNQKEIQDYLKKQKDYTDYFYNWERRTQEWIELLKSLEHLNPKIKQKSTFSYS